MTITKVHEAAWEKSFAELRAFREKHGHFRIPLTVPLGMWAHNQRYQYQKNGAALPGRRAQRLAEAGFPLNPRDVAWEDAFQALCEYRRREGHCRVPRAHVAEGLSLGRAAARSPVQLGAWAQKQREDRKNGELSEERRRRLEGAGFVWTDTKYCETGWEEKFQELRRYNEQEGDCHVPQRYSANPQLGEWVRKQRQNYKKGKLLQERLERLATIGFSWDRRNTNKTSPEVERRATKKSPPGCSTKGEKEKEIEQRAVDAKKQAIPMVEMHAASEFGTRRKTCRSTPLLSASPTEPSIPASATKVREENRKTDLSKNGSAVDKDMEPMQQQLAEARTRISELNQRLAASAEENANLTTEAARKEATAPQLRHETTTHTSESTEKHAKWTAEVARSQHETTAQRAGVQADASHLRCDATARTSELSEEKAKLNHHPPNVASYFKLPKSNRRCIDCYKRYLDWLDSGKEGNPCPVVKTKCCNRTRDGFGSDRCSGCYRIWCAMAEKPPPLSASSTKSDLPEKSVTKATEKNQTTGPSENGSAVDRDKESMQQQLAEARARISELSEEKTHLTMEVARKEAHASRLEQEKVTLMTKVAHKEAVQQQLAEAKARVSELSEEQQKLTMEVTRREADASRLRQEKVALMTEVAHKEADTSCLWHKTTAQQAEIARLNAVVRSREAEIARLNVAVRLTTQDADRANGLGAHGNSRNSADADEGFTPFLATDW